MNKERLSFISSILLKSMGADIVAPKEIADGVIKTLGLEQDSSFINISKELDSMGPGKQNSIIKALLLTRFTTSELMRSHDLISAAVKATLGYLQTHPEMTKEAFSEEKPCDLASALAALFGKD